MTDSTKDIRGADTNPRGNEPRRSGRSEVAGARTQTITESKYTDGQARHGINPANVNRGGSARYNHSSSKAHRAAERDSRNGK
jgi:hypothetical protein